MHQGRKLRYRNCITVLADPVCSMSGWLCVVKREMIRGCERLPSDISPVIDACEHALLSIFPQPRYRVGFSARLMSVLALLPEFIGDRILAKRLLIPGRPIP